MRVSFVRTHVSAVELAVTNVWPLGVIPPPAAYYRTCRSLAGPGSDWGLAGSAGQGNRVNIPSA